MTQPKAPALGRRMLLWGGAGTVVAAGVGTAGVASGVLPGRGWLRRELGLTGADGAVPSATPGEAIHGSFVSRRRGGVRTGWRVALPPGVEADDLPVLVFLHGLGQSHRTAFASLGMDRFLAASGARMAVAAVDGGRSYWHRRPSGEDAGAMVLEEFLPMLGRLGLAVQRPALMGISMGGYGALRLAGLLGREGCASVGAMSPALWSDPASASHSGFADAAEYARFSVFHRQADLRGIPVRLDCGTADPFFPDVRDYAAGLPHAARVEFAPGAHTVGYWRRVLPAQFEFAATALGAAG